jgi:hypothetical protein
MTTKKSAQRGSLTFDDVREIALSMPEVEETTAYGMPAFKAGKTRFAGQPIPRSDVDPNSLGVSVSFEERARLIAARPDVYYVTEHFANYPAVLARLANMRRDELRELLGSAWRHAMERQGPPKKKRRVAARGRR